MSLTRSRMPFVVKKNKPLNPIGVALFGTLTQATQTNERTHLLHALGL
jgi:hypothetical protein